MLYRLAKILMRTGLRLFYRHVYTSGMEHIPSRGPVIIIANHPSSLMDAALLGVLLKRRLWYFTRGDVFINAPVRKILWWLHMIPVHQHEKGRASLGANDDSFLEARNILRRNGVIVFFPESTSHTEHQLWPFRKGVFRLAFQTMEGQDTSFRLPVVPIGITYDHPVSGRQCVQVHAGAPLEMSDYTSQYQNNPSATILRMVKDAQDRMGKEVLHIDQADRCAVAKQCLVIYRNNHPTHTWAWKIQSRTRLEQEQVLCRYINQLSETTLTEIKEKNTAYFEALAGYGLNDKTIAGLVVREDTNLSGWKRLLVWAGFPLYIVGTALNGLPVWIARRIADTKVLREDFYSWIFVCCCCLLYSLWIIILAGSAWIVGWPYALTLLLLLPLTGLFSYYYAGWRREARQYRLLKQVSEQEVTTLVQSRAELNKMMAYSPTLSPS